MGTEYDRSCQTINKERCSTVNEKSCEELLVPKCTQQIHKECTDKVEPVCRTEYTEECKTVKEPQCKIQTETSCKDVVKPVCTKIPVSLPVQSTSSKKFDKGHGKKYKGSLLEKLHKELEKHQKKILKLRKKQKESNAHEVQYTTKCHDVATRECSDVPHKVCVE